MSGDTIFEITRLRVSKNIFFLFANHLNNQQNLHNPFTYNIPSLADTNALNKSAIGTDGYGVLGKNIKRISVSEQQNRPRTTKVVVSKRSSEFKTPGPGRVYRARFVSCRRVRSLYRIVTGPKSAVGRDRKAVTRKGYFNLRPQAAVNGRELWVDVSCSSVAPNFRKRTNITRRTLKSGGLADRCSHYSGGFSRPGWRITIIIIVLLLFFR